MFAATTHQIVKSLGKDTLSPVRSLDRADNIDVFSVVLKERRRRFLFWKRTQCLTTEFNLDNILCTPLADGEKEQQVKSRTLATFNYETNFALSGKLGVDLSKELLDVELDSSDSVCVKSSLGKLSKEEVVLQSFIDSSRDWRINLKHPLVAPLLNDSSKTLCLVMGVVRLTEDATISGKTNVKGAEEIKTLGDKVDETGSIEETRTKFLQVPAKTPLAYTEYELQISKEGGQFSVVAERSRRGGFVTSLSVDLDDVDGPSDAMGATTLFEGIQMMSEENRETLRLCILRIIQVPKCLDPLNDLLHKAADFLEMNIEKTTTLQSLQNKIFSQDETLLRFLFLAGFQQEEDGTISYPLISTEIFESCELLVSLLNELDDDELDATACCLQDPATSQALISTLRPVWVKDEYVVPLEGDQSWLTQEAGHKLTAGFGIQIRDNALHVPTDNLLDTQALYLLLDAFMMYV